MKMHTVPVLAGTAALFVLMFAGAPAIAQSPVPGPRVAAQADTTDALSEGEVRSMDKATGRITLRHGPLRNLDMPPMTMVFTVRDKSLLDRVQVGDKVRFRAIDDGGKYVVTEIQAAK